MLLIMLSIGLSALVGNVRSRKGPMPRLVTKVFLDGLARVLFLPCPPGAYRQSSVSEDKGDHMRKNGDLEKAEHAKMDANSASQPDLATDASKRLPEYKGLPYVESLERRLRLLEEGGRGQDQQPAAGAVQPDWMLLSILLDRLFIILYIFCIIANVVLFYPRKR